MDLIKTIPPRAHEGFAAKLRKELSTKPFDQVRIFDVLAKEHKVTGWNARRLARDQTTKTIGGLTQFRHQAVGVRRYEWWTSLDERVRPTHATKHSVEYDWDSPPRDTGHPGADIMCLPASARILPAGIEASVAYRYVGKVIEITLADGVVVSLTADHPILTAAGWKRAGDVDAGDKLVKHRGAGNLASLAIDPQVDDRYTSAEQLHRLLGGIGDRGRTVRRSVDLHGRPARRDEEVEIIPVPGHLRDHFDALGGQVFADLCLERPDMFTRPLDAFCYPDASPLVADEITGSGVRIGSQLLPFLGSHPGHADTVGFAGRPATQPEIVHAGVDHGALDAEPLSYREHGHPLLVQAQDVGVMLYPSTVWTELITGFDSDPEITQARIRDSEANPERGGDLYTILTGVRETLDGRVIRHSSFEPIEATVVRRLDYDGLVYNFQTHTGLIISDSIVSHNCRCVAIAITDDVGKTFARQPPPPEPLPEDLPVPSARKPTTVSTGPKPAFRDPDADLFSSDKNQTHPCLLYTSPSPRDS